MECFEIRSLSFAYPGESADALCNVSLSVNKGDFFVLCGESGCGKSTLLRQMKPSTAPHGRREGEILFCGTPLGELTQREQAEKIGFVTQSAENQSVTDKVWHELAFGLESLGMESAEIRRRVAEMAAFFGIESWFYKNVAELSGGQKQLLNIASVMVMQPEVLILDEPTSQLDPIAAAELVSALGRINHELGTTVILSEHRLEEVFELCTGCALMDSGKIAFVGTPEQVGRFLSSEGGNMLLSMPDAMRIWASCGGEGACPVSVCDGKRWLDGFLSGHEKRKLSPRASRPAGEPVLRADDVWFRYEKNSPDIVRGLTLSVGRGEIFALIGGNGAGKTTTLSLLAGLVRPQRGEISVQGRAAMLMQDVRVLFSRSTVREDILEVLPASERNGEMAGDIVRLCRLEALLDRHPYDLSGGEQQRAALAKLLLTDPDILLLDEPTRGMDAAFRRELGQLLRRLSLKGKTVVIVSHDLEFCAEFADECALFFDGAVTAHGCPRDFFAGSSFYTTPANRIMRDAEPEAVTVGDAIEVLGGKAERESEAGLREPAAYAVESGARRERFPLWRRIVAALSGAGALALIVPALKNTDLTALIGAEGLTELAAADSRRYAALIALLIVFALCVSKKSRPEERIERNSASKPSVRRIAAAILTLFVMIPLTLFAGTHFFAGRKYYFVSLLILLECMIPFFAFFEGRKPSSREIAVVAALCAMNVAGRAVFFMLPEFKPVVAVTILAGAVFGGETGFLVGAVTMLLSNMLFSQGPWTPWQMFAMGLIGLLAGIFYRPGGLKRTRLSLCVFGVVCSTVVYGGIMNPASAIMWAGKLNWGIILSYYVSGIPVDLVRAAGTFFFLFIGAEPMLEKLERVKTKYGIGE